jgi:hypothetical protein
MFVFKAPVRRSRRDHCDELTELLTGGSRAAAPRKLLADLDAKD